jgi:hypothetical protein
VKTGKWMSVTIQKLVVSAVLNTSYTASGTDFIQNSFTPRRHIDNGGRRYIKYVHLLL